MTNQNIAPNDTQSSIKRLNRQRILELFATGEKLTAGYIYDSTGISKPTIMRALQFFCHKGLLCSAGFGDGAKSSGKKPEYFVFCDKRKILSISMWPDAITLTLSGLVGESYTTQKIPHQLEDNLEDAFTYLNDIALEFLAQECVTLRELYAVLLSTAGTVDYTNNTLIYSSQTPGWGYNIPMEDYLCPIFGDDCKFFLENAGKVSSRSVLLDYPQLADKRILCIFSTWGISASMIEKGVTITGKDSLAGEIGHMTIDSSDSLRCSCGKKGCLEKVVSLQRISEKVSGTPLQIKLESNGLSFENIFEASEHGDPDARSCSEFLAQCFSVVIHNLSLAYNPDIVIFQGDFSYADEYFDSCLKSKLSEFKYFPKEKVIETFYDTHELSSLAYRGAIEIMRKDYFLTRQLD